MSRGVRVLHPADYRATDWSGGRTTELSIAPEGSLYAEREFLWRFSSATVETERSTFTSLPDYDRIILSLRGALRLSHDARRWMDFPECAPYAFDGGADTFSEGRIVDLNLMLRKGRCAGTMIPIVGGPGLRTDVTAALVAALPGAEELLIFCFEGAAEAVGLEGSWPLEAGDTLHVSNLGGGAWSVRATERVKAVVVAIRYEGRRAEN